MKKTTFFAIAFLFAIGLSAKKPTVKELQEIISVQDKTIESLEDTLRAIPDTLCVTALDSIFCVPTKDAQEVVVPIVDYIKETSDNGWPKTGKGWLTWLVALVPLIFGVKKLTAINNVWEVLKPYLKTRLGLAVVFGILLSVAATFLVSFVTKSDFNTTMLAFNGILAPLFASLIYNIKKAKKDAVQAG